MNRGFNLTVLSLACRSLSILGATLALPRTTFVDRRTIRRSILKIVSMTPKAPARTTIVIKAPNIYPKNTYALILRRPPCLTSTRTSLQATIKARTILVTGRTVALETRCTTEKILVP